MRKRYIEEKGYDNVEVCERERWSLYETNASVEEQHLGQSFFFERPRRAE